MRRRKYTNECPDWGPRDSHNFHDEDDGHELATCSCGAPNPDMRDSDDPPYVLAPDDNPPF